MARALKPYPPRSGVAAGTVCLVGAGPGDPDLLTLRALRALQHADVVVHDLLVSAEVLALVPRRAQLICAGKRAGSHTLAQEETNSLLVQLARSGRRVVRLKGGDPLIFGRGGEEAEFLARHGVAFELVPGITSASGAACCAGIPLTHRDCAQSLVFVTAHRKSGRLDLDWEMLARPSQTLVVYMGIGAASVISRELVSRGLPAATPAAIIEKATTPRQRISITSLGGLQRTLDDHAIQSPALIIIGEVVHRRAVLAPDRDRSSAGEAIVLTAAESEILTRTGSVEV